MKSANAGGAAHPGKDGSGQSDSKDVLDVQIFS